MSLTSGGGRALSSSYTPLCHVTSVLLDSTQVISMRKHSETQSLNIETEATHLQTWVRHLDFFFKKKNNKFLALRYMVWPNWLSLTNLFRNQLQRIQRLPNL